jgi:hypothetical protein
MIITLISVPVRRAPQHGLAACLRGGFGLVG